MQGSDVPDDSLPGASGADGTTSLASPPGGGGPESWNLDALPPELDYFRSSAAWQIELTGFQGPLDLLLYLIDKDQVDIYDIPIARITDQFIRHIEVMQSISLDQAGEFIAMAATLLVIKMKMLMPSRVDEEEEAEEDPRAELVRRLLEYKRFKEAALAFQDREDERARFHTRQLKFPFTNDLAVEPALRIEMFDLLAALAGIYDRVRKRPVHDIVREPFTVEEKIDLIAARTTDGALVRFEELFADDTIKMEVVVTFIAILEMVKRGRLVFVQTEPLGPIWLQRPAPGTVTGAEPAVDEPYVPEASSEAEAFPPAARLDTLTARDDDDDDDGWSDDDLDDDDDDDDDIDWDDEDDEDEDEDDDDVGDDDIEDSAGGPAGAAAKDDDEEDEDADEDDDDDDDLDDDDDEDWGDDDEDDWDDDDEDDADDADDDDDDEEDEEDDDER